MRPPYLSDAQKHKLDRIESETRPQAQIAVCLVHVLCACYQIPREAAEHLAWRVESLLRAAPSSSWAGVFTLLTPALHSGASNWFKGEPFYAVLADGPMVLHTGDVEVAVAYSRCCAHFGWEYRGEVFQE